MRATCVALLHGSSLRFGLCYPEPSSLSRPDPSHSQAHRNFTAAQLICDAFAVRERLGDEPVVDGCGEGRFSGAEHCLLPLRGIVWVILAKYSGSVFLRSNPFVRSAPSFRPDL